MTKLGPGAFEYYAALANERSYEAVAKKYGVSKRSVTKHAAKHDWQSRLTAIELAASVKTEKKLTTALEEMNERHLRVVKAVQARALEGLRSVPLRTGLEIVKALDFALRTERTILGEPNERSVLTIEEKIRTEYERWMSSENRGTVVDVLPAGVPA